MAEIFDGDVGKAKNKSFIYRKLAYRGLFYFDPRPVTYKEVILGDVRLTRCLAGYSKGGEKSEGSEKRSCKRCTSGYGSNFFASTAIVPGEALFSCFRGQRRRRLFWGVW